MNQNINFLKLTFFQDKEPPSFYDIFTFFNYFDYGVVFQDINEMYNPHEKNIDIK
jgi:hypothetical protein